MSRRGQKASSREITWVGSAFLVLCLAACKPFWNAPEGQAQNFIETLVMTPANMQQLRDSANIASERNPVDLLDGLSSRVAVDFLRAKLAQGATLKFAQSDARQIDASHRSVTVRVTYPEPGTVVIGEVQFQVQLDQDAQQHWQIARVTGSN
ncbi:MAG: hypothetical protein ACYDBA_03865 [Sulfuricaulis sp.]